MIKSEKNVFDKAPKHGLLLNIPLNSTPKAQLLRQIRGKVARREQFLLFTPNSEMVLASIYDQKFRDIVSKASFLVPDSVGIILAQKFLSLPKVASPVFAPLVYFVQGLRVGLAALLDKDWLFKEGKSVKGRKLFEDLIGLANKMGWRVFFVGGMGSEALKAAQSLKLSYQSLKVATSQGPLLNVKGEPVNGDEKQKEIETVQKINEFEPKLVFAAFGVPKGELWSTKWLPKLNTSGIMSVGGTFNYFAGNMSLPPRGMEKSLEWLWRVFQEPKRVGRIIRAVIVFPIQVYLYKLRN